MDRVLSSKGYGNAPQFIIVTLTFVSIVLVYTCYNTTKEYDVLIAQTLVGLQKVSSLTSSTDGNGVSGSGNDDLTDKESLKQWRKQVEDACKAATSLESVEMATKKSSEVFILPDANNVKSLPRGAEKTLKPCRRVVMDFGANIGDTAGHVVDSGLIGCERTDIDRKKKFFQNFDVEKKQFGTLNRRNPLTHHIIKLMKEVGQEHEYGPEDYCYYGVEGNPVFTQRLQAIEDFVMSIKPRPIHHMHFLTESVGAGKDGPTKLYLDTVNTKQNFWGSSIFENHQDVRKSAGQEGSVTAANVTGYTIGTLMRKTLAHFNPDATDSDKVNNHLILKVDIEGGEYPLLNQAVEDGTLCEFVKAGNKADLFIELHSQKVTGTHDLFHTMKGNKENLTNCGVNFRNLAAFWA